MLQNDDKMIIVLDSVLFDPVCVLVVRPISLPLSLYLSNELRASYFNPIWVRWSFCFGHQSLKYDIYMNDPFPC